MSRRKKARDEGVDLAVACASSSSKTLTTTGAKVRSRARRKVARARGISSMTKLTEICGKRRTAAVRVGVTLTLPPLPPTTSASKERLT